MEAELSARAVRCRDERLPGLLAAVRRRRIGRRRARVALAAACVVACLVAFLWLPPASRPQRPALALAEVSVATATAVARIVRDDPTVLARCAVPAVEREHWYLDDQGLQQLLQQAGCESGLIRAGGRLLAVAAVDALPTAP